MMRKLKIIDVSEYETKRIPSKTWRECIKKIWGSRSPAMSELRREIKIISFITEASVIRQILVHLNLWEERLSRDPPNLEVSTAHGKIIYEPFDDGWTQAKNAVAV